MKSFQLTIQNFIITGDNKIGISFPLILHVFSLLQTGPYPGWGNYKLEYCFTITYKNEGQRHYDLRTDTEAECNAWIDNVKRAPYSKVLEQKEELEQKHLHLLQILDSERQSKWQYVQQTEELGQEVKKIRTELQKFKKERIVSNHSVDEETDELKKIKKVQSFFRGWLCRRRWKQIVELYIRSPHAESMRKRNSIVFNMVECEEEYNRQLSTLVTCFLRPLRMAASSKKPPISHEDVNSIFLNSETLLFLHQIFLKGLCARLENWPTLVLGDLFDMLLPMLCIYQEYVRNHHYSLQVLAEYKQKTEFNALLKRYEEKPVCEGRSVEVFLTYPMHQIPRYIITLHELLAHTPHDHVERQSLEYAKGKLEELSRIMHDEVSETENIRKNLSIERMIVEGCDILLDVNQTFVRQAVGFVTFLVLNFLLHHRKNRERYQRKAEALETKQRMQERRRVLNIVRLRYLPSTDIQSSTEIMYLPTLDLDTQQVIPIPGMVPYAHSESSELSEHREDQDLIENITIWS
ncbi:Ras-specific guanine nucleotide-releasing factor 1 [Mytilus galloprovincialis]|uniref:Ras-specific guanine nucleotide-releasing factor 1 n=1 Tax=Mytilus galloprovincialis TaxID=29158 RepID=A0A8B6FGZ0_MYTGA|nr:Ras-specific guanine nucleotide-releasing factor 1 [Mytilus galloprovincialis]